MFYSTLLIATATLCGLASAQNYSTSGPLTVTPDSVSSDLRQSWCRGQTATCPEICGGATNANGCDADTLTYNCVCTNGNKPNVSDYDQTLPSFVCAQWVIDCVAAHPNDLTGQTACHSVVCGMKNASAVPQSGSGGSASSSAASSSASATGKPTKTGSTGSAASATNTGAAVALSVGKSYGTGILALGLAAVFGLAL